MQSPSFVVLQPGAVFHGRYRIVRCIKAGGMGAVYEVLDEKTDSRRALKVMLPSVVEDRDHRARFALEAKVTGAIESDHIVRVSDADIDEFTGTPFLVMDLLRGEELAELVSKRKILTPGEVVGYLYQAALALDKTHAAGIVHRDLKPENLFVTYRDDGSPCVKILDFGIAKVVAAQRQQAQATRALGTPLYMAPEQIRGEGAIGPRADLYALAQVAYKLLAGEAYWAEESKSFESLLPLLTKIVEGAKEPPTGRAWRRGGLSLAPGFDAWFFRATAPTPEARFERATTMITALAQAAGLAEPTPALSTASPSSALAAPAPTGLRGTVLMRQGTASQGFSAGQPFSSARPPVTVQQAHIAPRYAATPIPLAPTGTIGPSMVAVTPMPAPRPVNAARTGGESSPTNAAVTAPAARPSSRSAVPLIIAAIAVIGLGAVIAVKVSRRSDSSTSAVPAPDVASSAPPSAPSIVSSEPAIAGGTASPNGSTVAMQSAAGSTPPARPAGSVEPRGSVVSAPTPASSPPVKIQAPEKAQRQPAKTNERVEGGFDPGSRK